MKYHKLTAKSVILIVVAAVAAAVFLSCFDGGTESGGASRTVPFPLEDGGVMTEGGYFQLSGVTVTKTESGFMVKNGRSDSVIVTLDIVGVKKDGSQEWLSSPAFYGIDEAQYEADIKENGWAVYGRTNRVRPGEAIEMYAEIDGIGIFFDPDVDGDGYLDIVFNIIPQRSEDHVSVSTEDMITSCAYKLPR